MTDKLDQRRQTLLTAAAQVFIRYGFAKTTLEDIGMACGLNKASLYHYFANKEELFAAVVISEFTAFLDHQAKSISRQRSSTSRLTNYLLGRLDYLEKSALLQAKPVGELKRSGDAMRRLYQDLKRKEQKFLASWVADGIKAGEFRKVDAGKLAAMLLSVADAARREELTQQLETKATSAFDYTPVKERLRFELSIIFTGLQHTGK